jgi:hypothetical protein
VPQIVQPVADPGHGASPPPQRPGRILRHRVDTVAGKQPAVRIVTRGPAPDVFGENRQQRRRESQTGAEWSSTRWCMPLGH